MRNHIRQIYSVAPFTFIKYANMAPKNKGKAEDKSKTNAKASSSKDDKSGGGGGKLKAATAINTRHILVPCLPFHSY